MTSRDMTMGEADAWRAGAEAMREAALAECRRREVRCSRGLVPLTSERDAEQIAAAIRALPIPAPRPEPTGLDYRGG